MQNALKETREILKKLVSFAVMSGESNLDMVDYMVRHLDGYGIESELIYSEDKTRANLFVTIGPKTSGGIMLSGHTDVVHVTGQNWTHDPFDLIEKNSRLYGRGAVDMKGFLACCLASVPEWLKQDLKHPIQLGFTYDEETGGYGAKRLSQWLKDRRYKPSSAIIGEPTQMKIIAGHKGGNEVTTTIKGFEAHSSNPEDGVSAIHYAVKMINFILDKSEQLKKNAPANSAFNPPYTSFNIGTIRGGSSRNTIARHCQFDWEIRPIPEEDEAQIMQEIEDYCQQVLIPQMREFSAQAAIFTDNKAFVPGLSINPESEIIKTIKNISDNDSYDVVSFGTDAGYFQNIGIDSVVYGPGSLAQAHKPDEYIEISELKKCLAFLSDLGRHLS